MKGLGPWRRGWQGLLVLAVLVVPFLRVGGESLLRLDPGTLSLHAFGQTFRLEELSLFLLLCLTLVLGFLLVTLVLGRVWCGWACPQTVLVDVAEWFARRLGLRLENGRLRGGMGRRLLLHLVFALLALLVAANLSWYFVSPYAFFPRLWNGELGAPMLLVLAAIALPVYLDLALVRRLLCREFCPYGRFQTALIEPGTLTLRFREEEAERCRRCNACVRACPTGIDIRRGFQVECIACGRCLDACRAALAPEGEAGLIGYDFGSGLRGARSLLTPRLLLVGTAFLAASAGLVLATTQRPTAGLEVARQAAAVRTLEGGGLAVFFTAFVANLGSSPQTFDLEARDEAGRRFELRGPVDGIALEPGGRRRVDFALVVPPETPPGRVLLLLRDAAGREADAAAASLPGAPNRTEPRNP